MPFAGAEQTARSSIRRLGRAVALVAPAPLGGIDAAPGAPLTREASGPGRVYRVRAARVRPEAERVAVGGGGRPAREAAAYLIERVRLTDPDTGAPATPAQGWHVLDGGRRFEVNLAYAVADGAAWRLECSRRLPGAP